MVGNTTRHLFRIGNTYIIWIYTVKSSDGIFFVFVEKFIADFQVIYAVKMPLYLFFGIFFRRFFNRHFSGYCLFRWLLNRYFSRCCLFRGLLNKCFNRKSIHFLNTFFRYFFWQFFIKNFLVNNIVNISGKFIGIDIFVFKCITDFLITVSVFQKVSVIVNNREFYLIFFGYRNDTLINLIDFLIIVFFFQKVYFSFIAPDITFCFFFYLIKLSLFKGKEIFFLFSFLRNFLFNSLFFIGIFFSGSIKGIDFGRVNIELLIDKICVNLFGNIGRKFLLQICTVMIAADKMLYL